MEMVKLCGLLFLAVLASGSEKPCCGPTKWSANIVQTLGEYNRDLDSASLGYSDTNVYYDYDDKKLAFKQTLDNQTTSTITHRWIIMDYNLGEKFVIINKTCTSSTLRGSMESPCIPDDAAFLGTHTYSGNLRVNVWLVKDNVNGGTRRIGVTENNCLRTSLSSITGGPDYHLDVSLYQNVTMGISDPSVFDIPSFCTKIQKHKGDMENQEKPNSVY